MPRTRAPIGYTGEREGSSTSSPADGPTLTQYAWLGAFVAGLAALTVTVTALGEAGAAPAAAPSAQAWTRPNVNDLPANVQDLLTEDWSSSATLSSPGVTTADTVDSLANASGWIGSNTLPGTITVGAPNAAGAVMVIWVLNGQRFQ